MKNRLDEMVVFSMARHENIDEIMTFFSKYWKPNHILSTNKSFFEYEFCDESDRVNFLLARDKIDNSLIGVYGFYTYVKGNKRTSFDIAGGPSRVSPFCKYPLLGVELYKRLPIILCARSVIGVGLNEKTSYQISKNILKRYVGRMRHFYRLGDRMSYTIPFVIEKKILPITEMVQYELNEVFSIEELDRKMDVNSYIWRVPFKDKGYINKRYFEHPVYKYKIFVLMNHMAIITREIKMKTGSILRIVDVIGDYNYLRNIGVWLDNYINQKGYEYADLMESGLDDTILNDMGFVDNDSKKNIIPNYFEPFERANIDVLYDSTDPSAVIFKADADQDRPNIV